MSQIVSRVDAIEEYISQKDKAFNSQVRSVIENWWKQKIVGIPKSETYFGLLTALVVDTKDMWKQGRIRYFSPLMHAPNMPIKKLPWAWPVSPMGGFDDSGLFWVPPASSSVAILFEAGSRHSAYYIGTTWHRTRKFGWGMNIEEYENIHKGHRNGYLLGNDETDVLPPWNTENYNGIDINDPSAMDPGTDAYKKLTYSNIYGFKTPQKHMMKLVDGDYNCSHKHKRIEILSSCGNWMVFKDDHMREFIPKVGEFQNCLTESEDCENKKANSPYFKHKNELRPWDGPRTPQNNKCELKQSGIQFLSISGHTLYMDDSVEKPRGIKVPARDKDNINGMNEYPGCPWERSMQPFDFGCNDKFKGKFVILSATGHKIELGDDEEITSVRSNKNYIKFLEKIV
jgi:hypothetical protein